MITASFLTQYGVRIYSKEFKAMTWEEFAVLLAGLSEDTPLGRMVRIRSEDDRNVLKHFTARQRRLRAEWRNRAAKQKAQKNKDNPAAIEQIRQMFIGMSKVRR